jgi:cell division protein FtsQ
MSRKIKRGGASAGRAAARQDTARKVNAARVRTGSVLDRALAAMPFDETQLQRIFLVMILGAAVCLAWVVAVMAGVPALVAGQVALLAQKAGFEVNRVEVRGVHHLNELKIYEQVLAERNHAMTRVDLGALRSQLMRLSWVQDARVSRQLPDTLIVDIVERKPHAVLRQADHLVLIDDSGHVLEPISPNRVAGELVLSGDGADGQVRQLSRLLDAAPALQPQVSAAEWKGYRRWNLTFRTNQVLYLPEGEHEAANALIAFARMDGANRLLGGRAVAFDMRAPDRIYIRIPGHGAELAAATKEKLAQAAGERATAVPAAGPASASTARRAALAHAGKTQENE